MTELWLLELIPLKIKSVNNNKYYSGLGWIYTKNNFSDTWFIILT
jgi:hypothetical protein